MSALSDPENVWLVPADSVTPPPTDTSEMTEDEAYAYLSRNPGMVASAFTQADSHLRPITAAVDAETQDYSALGMVALVPSAVDAERLVMEGGELLQDLHLTLFFLGDVTQYPSTMMSQVAANLQTVTQGQFAISANVFGAAIWNPDSDMPCLVLSVGGETLEHVRHEIGEALEDVCRYLHPTRHTADKCTLCYHRLSQGLLPACVEVCPTQARVIGDLKGAASPLTRFRRMNKINVLKPSLNTEPKVYYANLDGEVR